MAILKHQLSFNNLSIAEETTILVAATEVAVEELHEVGAVVGADSKIACRSLLKPERAYSEVYLDFASHIPIIIIVRVY